MSSFRMEDHISKFWAIKDFDIKFDFTEWLLESISTSDIRRVALLHELGRIETVYGLNRFVTNIMLAGRGMGNPDSLWQRRMGRAEDKAEEEESKASVAQLQSVSALD